MSTLVQRHFLNLLIALFKFVVVITQHIEGLLSNVLNFNFFLIKKKIDFKAIISNSDSWNLYFIENYFCLMINSYLFQKNRSIKTRIITQSTN